MTKLIRNILFILLAAAIGTGAVVGIIYLSKSLNPSDPGDIGGTTTRHTIAAISNEGDVFYDGGTYAMPAAMTIVAEAPKAGSYSPKGEVTLTATVSNEYIKGLFDFTCYFVDESDSWAKGKDAGDYISITPVSHNQAKVALLAAFGSPIEIKAQLINTDSYATCRVDYLQRIESHKLGLVGSDVSDSLGLELNVTFGIGTVKGDLNYNSGSISILDAFQDAVKSYLSFDIAFKSLVLNKSEIQTGTHESGYFNFEVDAPGYAAFILDFNNYDKQHKEAIYYAWYTAWNTTFSKSPYGYNTLLDIDVTYSYLENRVGSVIESAYVDGYISGEYYGAEISPDIELNPGITF